jgi:hypothetical protein
MAGRNNKAGRGAGGPVSSKRFRRVGEEIGMNSTQRLSGPGIRNTIRSRKAPQSRVLGTALTGHQATVQGLAMMNGAHRKGYGKLDIQRNLEKAKRLNLV